MAINLQTIESLPLVEEVNENTSLVGWDGEKTVRVASDMVGGSGLPEGGEPHKQLVTDSNGNTVWEDKLCYVSTEMVDYFPEQSITADFPEEAEEYGHSYGYTLNSYDGDWDKKPFELGKMYYIHINGTEYALSPSEEMEPGSDYMLSVRYIGNKNLGREEYEDTGENFCIATEKDYIIISWRIELGRTITIGISEEQETVTQIDSKFVNASPFIINIKSEYDEEYESDRWSSDKSYDEILKAYQGGKQIQAILNKYVNEENGTESNEGILALSEVQEYGFVFKGYRYGTNVSASIYEAGEGVEFYEENVQHLPDWVNEDNAGDVLMVNEYGSWDVTSLPSGLPENSEPHKALVTNGDGETIWDDRLAWEENKITEIVWDGVTEGKLEVRMGMVGIYHKVSDVILSEEAVKTGKIIERRINGEIEYEGPIIDDWDNAVGNGDVTEDYVFSTFAAFVFKENTNIWNYTFPEPGIYFNSYNVSAGSSFVTSSHNIKTIDPKFLPEGLGYKENKTLEIMWDGNLENKLSIREGSTIYYKVSDVIPTEEIIKAGKFVYLAKDGFSEDSEQPLTDVWDAVYKTDDFIEIVYMLCILKENTKYMGATFSEPGIYFMDMGGNGSIGISGFVTNYENIKTIAPELLPTEEWTFTLEDGSTVTKKVVIG